MGTAAGGTDGRGVSWGGSRRGVSWGGGRAVKLGALVSTLGITLSLLASPAMADGSYVEADDQYAMANVVADMGATTWWNAGYTGKGVDVAVIDSGVSPVPGLDGEDKIINGPDLSFDSQADNLRYLDGYGHGTFMAGLIAGKDAGLTQPYSTAPASAYRGIAPDARIVNLKVGAGDGAVDVIQVIAAINWAVEHRNDNGLNIRVISLSYGTNSLQNYGVDPLAFAVEQAWKKGIVVVAAAGNTGYQKFKGAPGLADPAYSPTIMAVGGYDQMGTAVPKDDKMGSYSASSAGCASCKKPDFVAIGSHLQGLRVPGGFIDTMHPEGIISDRYFRGSGTSQATAVAAGAIALILQKYPNLTPDQVRRFITDNAQKVPGMDSEGQGAGELWLQKLATRVPANYKYNYTASTGLGSLELSRGSDHLTDDNADFTGTVDLQGGTDIFGEAVDVKALAAATASGSTWSDGSFLGRSWSGSGWSGRSWSGAAWSGRSWSGRSWSGRSWSTGEFTGRSWSGRSWSNSDFCGDQWSGKIWADGSWD